MDQAANAKAAAFAALATVLEEAILELLTHAARAATGGDADRFAALRERVVTAYQATRPVIVVAADGTPLTLEQLQANLSAAKTADRDAFNNLTAALNGQPDEVLAPLQAKADAAAAALKQAEVDLQAFYNAESPADDEKPPRSYYGGEDLKTAELASKQPPVPETAPPAETPAETPTEPAPV